MDWDNPVLVPFMAGIVEVRDAAIDLVRVHLAGDVEVGGRWRSLLAAGRSEADLVDEVVVDLVDLVLTKLLTALEDPEMPFGVRQVDGSHIQPHHLSWAEFAGWWLDDEPFDADTPAWRARFSRHWVNTL